MEVVDRPEVATKKSSPRTFFDTAIGFIVGIIIAFIIIVIRAVSDTTVYLSEDLESIPGLTVLGQIPNINVSGRYSYWSLKEGGVISYEKITMPKQNAKNEAVSANRKRLLNNDSPFAIKESYVKLRTILMFCMTADSKRACRTFAITSSNPSDGKSLTAANVAISFAMLGKKRFL